jgi:ubiquinone/menaquinone biosynthesis C-methylase UbiE
MRNVTLQIAFEPGGWTPERAKKVEELFDGLAPDWHTRFDESRFLAMNDALDRGGPFEAGGWCLELGSGIGLFTPSLTARFDRVVAVDVAFEMLRRAEPIAPRVRSDGSRLPFADRSFATVVLVNMFLFPAEMDRLLIPGGRLVWVNTYGPATPIHLSAEEVQRALPRDWTGVHAEAGWGTWASLQKPV